VTADTFHAERSSLKASAVWNNSLMSVMAEVSHTEMSPYIKAAAAESLLYSLTASFSSSLRLGAKVSKRRELLMLAVKPPATLEDMSEAWALMVVAPLDAVSMLVPEA